jgi:hypothetical protein
VLAALRETVQRQGIFCALYSDRASHFLATPQAGGKIDPQRLTQVGRALQELGIQMIPAYSPQASGRSERNFRTWQGRLPQELRLRGISTLEDAHQFLRDEYIAEFNRRFRIQPTQPGSAFLPCRHQDLDLVFSIQQARTVARDNTIQLGTHWLQNSARPLAVRNEWSGCHPDARAPALATGQTATPVGALDNAQGWPLLEQRKPRRRKAVEKPLRGKPQVGFPLRLEIPQHRRDFHFPTTRTAAKGRP